MNEPHTPVAHQMTSTTRLLARLETGYNRVVTISWITPQGKRSHLEIQHSRRMRDGAAVMDPAVSIWPRHLDVLADAIETALTLADEEGEKHHAR